MSTTWAVLMCIKVLLGVWLSDLIMFLTARDIETIPTLRPHAGLVLRVPVALPQHAVASIFLVSAMSLSLVFSIVEDPSDPCVG